MPLRLKPGDRFPEVALTDDGGRTVTPTQVADGRPLILVFYRGPW